jgi:hypothetical protein
MYDIEIIEKWDFPALIDEILRIIFREKPLRIRIRKQNPKRWSSIPQFSTLFCPKFLSN